MLTESVHRLSQIGAFLFDFSSSFNDLLVKNLVAVRKVSHPGAENHGILIHVHSDLTFFGDELDDRLAILGALKDFVGFLELFQVLDFQEIVQANGRFQFFRATESLQESSELLLALHQELIGTLFRLKR